MAKELVSPAQVLASVLMETPALYTLIYYAEKLDDDSLCQLIDYGYELSKKQYGRRCKTKEERDEWERGIRQKLMKGANK